MSEQPTRRTVRGARSPRKLPRSAPPVTARAAAKDPTAGPSYIAPDLWTLVVPLSAVKLDPKNARKHGQRNLDTIRDSLREHGQQKPIVVNQDGLCIAGNGTLLAANGLGWKSIARVRFHVQAGQKARPLERAYALRDNRSAELAEWDLDVLTDELTELLDAGIDLADVGWDAEEVEALFSDDPIGAGTDPGAETHRAQELQAKWGTALGQLWEISSATVPGKSHRLLCGDSRKREDVARVMNGERAGLMNIDPPYGVNYENDDRPHPGVAKPRVAKDELHAEDLQEFLVLAFRAAVENALRENAAWYLWHAHLTQGFFAAAAAAAAANVVLHRQIIWVKPVMLLTRGQYHWKHEPCFFGWVQGHEPPDYGRGNGERDQTTVWEIAGVTMAEREEFNHSMPKPSALFAGPLVKHLRAGEIAFDGFAGSGPQFVAAEQTGRRCFGIEVDPAFVAVTLERMKGMGLEPRLT